MQKLIFEPSWDKTISQQDRNRIIQSFHKTSLSNNEDIQFTTLWQAENHKGELLITVLIHNCGNEAISFHQKTIRYMENNMVLAEHAFSHPSLIVEGQTSMPWTFIFPVGSFEKKTENENGVIVI